MPGVLEPIQEPVEAISDIAAGSRAGGGIESHAPLYTAPWPISRLGRQKRGDTDSFDGRIFDGWEPIERASLDGLFRFDFKLKLALHLVGGVIKHASGVVSHHVVDGERLDAVLCR
jgi:hypothetical protein